MNKDKITAMCRKVSNETGLTFNSVMTYYFLESVLRKLSISKYNDKEEVKLLGKVKAVKDGKIASKSSCRWMTLCPAGY